MSVCSADTGHFLRVSWAWPVRYRPKRSKAAARIRFLGVDATLSASNLGPCSSINSNMTFRPHTEGELYIAGPTQSSNISTALGVNTPAGGYHEVAFGSSIKTFGADLFQNMGGGLQSEVGQPFLAVILGAGNAVLGSFNFNIAATTGGFFGFTSVQNVTAVRISQTTGFAVMDNVSIGAASTSTVPEPSMWALMVAALCAVGVVARRGASSTVGLSHQGQRGALSLLAESAAALGQLA